MARRQRVDRSGLVAEEVLRDAEVTGGEVAVPPTSTPPRSLDLHQQVVRGVEVTGRALALRGSTASTAHVSAPTSGSAGEPRERRALHHEATLARARPTGE